jgi:hypothetical protein
MADSKLSASMGTDASGAVRHVDGGDAVRDDAFHGR